MSKLNLSDVLLASLLEVTRAINSNAKTPHLVSIYETVLREKLRVGNLMLYVNEGEWKCLLHFGIQVAFTSEEIKRYLIPLKEITLLDTAPADEFFPVQQALRHNNVEVVIPVFHKDIPLAYVLVGNIDKEQLGIGSSVKHLNFIQTLTNILIVAIENKRLARASIRQAAMKKEMEVASQMQQMLFPSDLPNDAQLEMSALYIAHQQIGGDYYDFIRINEHEVAFCMADVSGKGVSAALLMSNFQANMRILLNRSTSLAELVVELNEKVNVIAKGERFITLFVAKYNIRSKIFTYVNAGHNPPLVLSPDDSVSMLRIGCTGLGMLDHLRKVQEGVVTMNPGAVILCYTDGVVEQENEAGEEFGVNRLKEILLSKGHKAPMKEVNNFIIESVKEYKGSNTYVDDIALLTCRIC